MWEFIKDTAAIIWIGGAFATGAMLAYLFAEAVAKFASLAMYVLYY